MKFLSTLGVFAAVLCFCHVVWLADLMLLKVMLRARFVSYEHLSGCRETLFIAMNE